MADGSQMNSTHAHSAHAGRPSKVLLEVSDLHVAYGKAEVVHDRTKEPTPPKFPFECKHPDAGSPTRRAELASWITSPDNPYFARGYVNRLWGYLFGVGLVEPLDDVRAGNPPSNPELLDHLTAEFLKGGFHVRRMIRDICTSRTYQLSVETNKFNADDKTNYSHAVARRLPAEGLFDAVNLATGSTSRIPGVPAGTRAAAGNRERNRR